MILNADSFAGVFTEQQFEIVKHPPEPRPPLRYDGIVAGGAIADARTAVPIIRTQSRGALFHQSVDFGPRLVHLSRCPHAEFGRKVSMKSEELWRFLSIQAQRTEQTLARAEPRCLEYDRVHIPAPAIPTAGP
ncbi:hypothetical protein CONPUDRAFT_156779 [Coniophora puteana RWD-64-598 SS2]|uniref:Uncharacterized protein n=1 Tax=Coniophora puteana (strain RWD-64-598) TaxID=741705 RepID=A0A5M3MF65_CONPW|nr:uncharacterized protein CONPUDRAFT_156779 [Coniophora puteana RWD-64-598 SS2]EIW77570.1 hypothetical protein CONPUDRAFT_156779 [Coniophora puteana RWD-64-598 SS2]